ncbi:MAG: hypothetical protein ACYDCD_15610 [Candidatus Acidiferrales bacterium]
MKKTFFLLALLALAVPLQAQEYAKAAPANAASAAPTRMMPGARVYIVPNQGFEDSLSAAITKKKVPVVVVEKESEAQFKVESTIDFKKGSTARAIFLRPGE